jgi:hypothetical protein
MKMKMCELIDPYRVRAKRYFRCLKFIKLLHILSFGKSRFYECSSLLRILDCLSLNTDLSVGIEFPDEETLGDTSKLYLFRDIMPEDRIYALSDNIMVENSEMGVWHFYLLMSSVHFLPLWDHAVSMDRKFIASRRQLIFTGHEYSGTDDLRPFVNLTKTSENSSESILSACYSSEWGGLFRETYRLVINDNHVKIFERISDDCLLEYHCHIML